MIQRENKRENMNGRSSTQDQERNMEKDGDGERGDYDNEERTDYVKQMSCLLLRL